MTRARYRFMMFYDVLWRFMSLQYITINYRIWQTSPLDPPSIALVSFARPATLPSLCHVFGCIPAPNDPWRSHQWNGREPQCSHNMSEIHRNTQTESNWTLNWFRIWEVSSGSQRMDIEIELMQNSGSVHDCPRPHVFPHIPYPPRENAKQSWFIIDSASAQKAIIRMSATKEHAWSRLAIELAAFICWRDHRNSEYILCCWLLPCLWTWHNLTFRTGIVDWIGLSRIWADLRHAANWFWTCILHHSTCLQGVDAYLFLNRSLALFISSPGSWTFWVKQCGQSDGLWKHLESILDMNVSHRFAMFRQMPSASKIQMQKLRIDPADALQASISAPWAPVSLIWNGDRAVRGVTTSEWCSFRIVPSSVVYGWSGWCMEYNGMLGVSLSAVGAVPSFDFQRRIEKVLPSLKSSGVQSISIQAFFCSSTAISLVDLGCWHRRAPKPFRGNKGCPHSHRGMLVRFEASSLV